MKFVLLEARGEDGRANVGMVGGSPLLVTGSIKEVAAKISADWPGRAAHPAYPAFSSVVWGFLQRLRISCVPRSFPNHPTSGPSR
jgi:hypothetical protein